MKICFILILSFVVLLFAPNIAFACSCGPPPPIKSNRNPVTLEFEKSKAVFSGEVTKISIVKAANDKDLQMAEIHFKVLRTWKGVTTESVSVFTANVCCFCGYSFSVGERYLVYTLETKEAKLYTDICTRTKLLSESNEDLKVLGKGKALKRNKESFENNGKHNKSMDVRAKQRLCYQTGLLTRSCVDSVSPHVISSVIHPVEKEKTSRC